MSLSLLTFILYLLVAGNTTYFLGRSLYTNGEHFLASIFLSRPEIVQPLNKVLLAGFYLINIGFVLLFFTQQHNLSGMQSCVEFLSKKLGAVYLVLGCMHLFNILVFITIERKLYTNPKH
ncbi:MAG: aankyrin [Chitinophagaceae bacterium]|nr:aankyrin [Chitinophagaceae bacterium]